MSENLLNDLTLNQSIERYDIIENIETFNSFIYK